MDLFEWSLIKETEIKIWNNDVVFKRDENGIKILIISTVVTMADVWKWTVAKI